MEKEGGGTRRRKGKVVDVWVNPASSTLVNHLPEALRLFQLSDSPFFSLTNKNNNSTTSNNNNKINNNSGNNNSSDNNIINGEHSKHFTSGTAPTSAFTLSAPPDPLLKQHSSTSTSAMTPAATLTRGRHSHGAAPPLGVHGRRSESVPAETLLEGMDAAGVDKVMVCSWCRPNQWLFTNEDVVHHYTSRYPSRFVGVATVDLSDPVIAVETLEKAVCDYNFKALRIVGWLWKLPPNDKLYYPLYVKCVQLGIPVCLQVGRTGPMMPSEPGRPIPYLEEVALTFPDLKIVGGHIGYPWTDEMIGLTWKFPNVYIDTSAYIPRAYPPELVKYMKTSQGKKKVLFGTNFPQLGWKRCVDGVEKELGLNDDVWDHFMWKNAYDVFGLEDDGSHASVTKNEKARL